MIISGSGIPMLFLVLEHYGNHLRHTLEQLRQETYFGRKPALSIADWETHAGKRCDKGLR